MIRGKFRVIRQRHICINVLPACVSLFPFPLLRSPAVSKVGKPRWGHPLVEFVIVGLIVRKK